MREKLSDGVKLSVSTHLSCQFVLRILCSLVRTKSDFWDIFIRFYTSEMRLYVTGKDFTFRVQKNSGPGLYLFDTGQQSGANVKAIHIRAKEVMNLWPVRSVGSVCTMKLPELLEGCS